MKKPWLTLLVALFAVFVSPHAQAAVVEKVVAVVNDRIVTLSELNKEIREITTVPGAQADVQEVLDAMVDRILLDQQAAVRKISVSDEEVKAIVKSQRQALNLDEKAIAQELKKQNMTEKLFYRQWKYQILSRRLLDSVTQGSIAVTDKEIEEHRKEHYGEEETIYGMQTKIAHILINQEAENADSRAQEVLELAKSGESFAQLAREYSMDESSAQRGGVLGYFVKGDLVAEIENAVEKTEVNGIAGPVRTSQGYHIIKVLERTAGEESSISRYKDRIKHQIYMEKVEQYITSWLEDIKKNSYIEIKI
ncbi:MAG: peptidylprolyl isomerase [Candidatus Dadabacteria bacterium]|nr:peptidylprolyl isomerase [Candidatus Dadabacteria bacterium]MDE0520292.1 peptidylprolyl isomerase [Candidatus Dadabacteria bacterium]MDE0663250.1 peptidylprolyl isomerase [Candidatus Dadabacteria bacterium]